MAGQVLEKRYETGYGSFLRAKALRRLPIPNECQQILKRRPDVGARDFDAVKALCRPEPIIAGYHL